MSLYRIRFKELNNGRDGGYGETKSFKASASSPHKAAQKLRRKAMIISVRRIK